MGIKSLNKLIGHLAVKQDIEVYRGKNVGIDVSLYLHRYAIDSKKKGDLYFLRGFVDMILELFKYDITPIFVFDGKPPKAKRNELIKRKEHWNKIFYDLTSTLCGDVPLVELDDSLIIDDMPVLELNSDNWFDVIKKIKQFKSFDENQEKKILDLEKKLSKHVHINLDKIKMLKKLFQYFKVSYIQSSMEADHCLAWLSHNKQIDAVMSDDMDMLTHGATILIKDFMNFNYFRNKRNVTEYNLKTIIDDLKMSQKEFIDMCILCGCDYNSSCRISKIGPKTALNLINTHRTLEIVLLNLPSQCKINEEYGFNYKKCRKLFRLMSKDKYNKCRWHTFPDKHMTKECWKSLYELLSEHCRYRTSTLEKKIEELKNYFSKQSEDPDSESSESESESESESD